MVRYLLRTSTNDVHLYLVKCDETCREDHKIKCNAFSRRKYKVPSEIYIRRIGINGMYFVALSSSQSSKSDRWGLKFNFDKGFIIYDRLTSNDFHKGVRLFSRKN
jgi:hypothetical protein